MNLNWLKTTFHTGRRFIVRNSPTILTALSGAGTISAVIFAVKDTPKAERRIALRKQELGVSKLTPMETVKVCWPVYIPTAGMTLASIACGVGANSINIKRNATLAGLYATTERTMREYQNRVVEAIGEEAEKDIREKAEAKATEKSCTDGKSPILVGDEMCKDMFSGQYFRADKNVISRWESEVLTEMATGSMYVSCDDVYDIAKDACGIQSLERPMAGEGLGWTIDDKFRIRVTRADGNDGKVLNEVTFDPPPHENYYKMY